MDVDSDGQRLGDHAHNSAIMNAASDVAQKPAKLNDAPVTTTKSDVAGLIDASPQTEPSKGVIDGAQQANDQTSFLPPKRPLPPLTANLLSLYGLQPLVATVARTDPVTGEKINRMRKSYDGQLKALGLSGRNRSVKHEEGKGLMGLQEMAMWPDEEWKNQKVHGKDVRNGLSEATLAKLDKAMHMQPGPVPNNSEWEDLLGHEKVKPAEQNAKTSKLPSTGLPKANGQINGATANAEANRPKRQGKKRRYDDSSFEGYAEGFVDDDVDMGGYSSGDTQFSKKSASNKKRKKDYSSNLTGLSDRPGNFTSTSLGISAYGR